MTHENEHLQQMMRKAVAKKKSHSPPGMRSQYMSHKQSRGQLHDDSANYSRHLDEMSPVRGSYEIRKNMKYQSGGWQGRQLERQQHEQSGSPPQPISTNPSRYGHHPGTSFEQNPRNHTFVEERKFRTGGGATADSHSYPTNSYIV